MLVANHDLVVSESNGDVRTDHVPGHGRSVPLSCCSRERLPRVRRCRARSSACQRMGQPGRLSGDQLVPLSPGQAGQHQVVGMIDEFQHLVIRHRTVERHGVPVPLIQVVARGDGRITAAQDGRQGGIAVEADAAGCRAQRHQRPYAHELNPAGLAWSHLKRSLANLAKRNLAQLTALVKTRLRRMQYRPALLGGFPASTGLDLTPFCDPQPLEIFRQPPATDRAPLGCHAGC